MTHQLRSPPVNHHEASGRALLACWPYGTLIASPPGRRSSELFHKSLTRRSDRTIVLASIS
jgi:hypothetical protein